MNKAENRNVSQSHDIELLIEKTLLIILLHKLFSFIDFKKILAGFFYMVKNKKNFIKYFFISSIIFLVFSFVCEFPSLYYNSHSSSVAFSKFTEYFWLLVNIFDVIYTPFLIIFIIYLWKIRKIK